MNAETLRITRFFNAPRPALFAALTQPQAMMRWFGPRGCTCPSVALDAQVGGRYRVEMHGIDSGQVMVLTGQYHDLRPPEKLVFSWTWAQGDMAGVETLVTITLAERNGGTELTLQHEGLASDRAVQMHADGWGSSLDCLAEHLDGRDKEPLAQPVVLGDPRSTYTRTVRMALHEKDIAYRMELRRPGEPAMAEFHPFGRIPAYRQGGLKLFETSAILRYVDETFPGPSLLPDNPIERALMEQWLSAISSYMFGTMVRNYVLQYVFPRGADGQPDRGVIERAVPEIEHQIAQLNQAYGTRDHLVGEWLSLADLLLAPIVHYLQQFPESRAALQRHGNVVRAHASVAQRPSFVATLPG